MNLTLKNTIELSILCEIARDAGAEILDVYASDFDFETKGDGSPLTLADQRANDLIEARLTALTPDIPILSEETFDRVGDQRLEWPCYWLVDPLDGTREFIKRNGEFTVNIALIENGVSVIGVVYAPVLDELYFAATGEGAFKQRDGDAIRPIRCRPLDSSAVKVVASRSHLSDEVKQFVASVERRVHQVELISMGSSLKLCLIADGRADFYPRLGLTSEWDTAAAQCVVEVAGGRVIDCNGSPLRYSKADILNPWFMVIADPRVSSDCKGIDT